MNTGKSTLEPVTERIKIQTRGKKGIWQAHWYDEAGEHRHKSLKNSDRRIAEREARKLDSELEQGELPVRLRKLALRDALDAYLRYLKTEQKAPKTQTKYGTELQWFVDFCDDQRVVNLQQVRMDTYLAYRGFRQEQRQEKAGKPLSKSSLHDLAVTLKSFFKWCVDTEKLSTNPLAKVKIGKPSRQEGFCPTLPHVEAMLRLAEPPLRARLAVLAMTGMRAGELQRLRPENVDMKGNWIHIRSRPDAPTKTGQSRKVPIHPLLRPILEQQLHESAGKPWLFCAEVTRQYPKGDHCIDIEHLNTAVQRVARRADIQTGRAALGMVTHSLRHFLKTHAMYAGVPEPIRDAWLGHKSDDRPGNRYLHVHNDESQRYMKTLVFTLTDLVSESDSKPNERELHHVLQQQV